MTRSMYKNLDVKPFWGHLDTDELLRVRACPQTPYAIAWWFYNNFSDECSNLNWSRLTTDEYIVLITENKMTKKIYKELWDIARTD